MPLKKLTEITQLPRDAEDELPHGDERFNDSKGTLGWWVIVASFSIALIFMVLHISSLTMQVADLKAENKELDRDYRTLLQEQINTLRPLKVDVRNVEEKVDSITPK